LKKTVANGIESERGEARKVPERGSKRRALRSGKYFYQKRGKFWARKRGRRK